MILAVEWKRLFSALKIFKIALYGYASIFHFSERFSWLTCVDIFFNKWDLSQVCGKQSLFYSPVFVHFSIALEAI